MDLAETFIEPFSTHAMRQALVAVALIAVPAGLLGAWVVVRRLAFAAHAVGHATFPALVVAALAGWSLLGTTVVAALIVGALLAALTRRPEIRSQTASAIVLSTSLAIGAVLVSDVRDPGVSANGLLFGSVFGLSSADLLVAGGVAAVALASTLIGFRPFAVAAFDAVSARAVHHRVDLAQMVTIAAAVGVSARLMGSLLVGAMFVIPSLTARQFTNRLPSLMAWGVAVAALDGVAGLWMAAQLDTPPGATIAAVAAAAFTAVALGRAVARRVLPAWPGTVPS